MRSKSRSHVVSTREHGPQSFPRRPLMLKRKMQEQAIGRNHRYVYGEQVQDSGRPEAVLAIVQMSAQDAGA